jgi:hypothetical protein
VLFRSARVQPLPWEAARPPIRQWLAHQAAEQAFGSAVQRLAAGARFEWAAARP